MLAAAGPYLKWHDRRLIEAQRSRSELLTHSAQVAENCFCRNFSTAIPAFLHRRSQPLSRHLNSLWWRDHRRLYLALRILQVVILDVLVKAFLDVGVTNQLTLGHPQNCCQVLVNIDLLLRKPTQVVPSKVIPRYSI